MNLNLLPIDLSLRKQMCTYIIPSRNLHLSLVQFFFVSKIVSSSQDVKTKIKKYEISKNNNFFN